MNSHALFQFLFYLLPKKEKTSSSSFIACPAYSSLNHSLCMLIARDVERHFCSKRPRKRKNAPFVGFDFQPVPPRVAVKASRRLAEVTLCSFQACYHAVRISWKHSAAFDSLDMLFRVWAILGVCFTNCVFYSYDVTT